MPDRRDDVDSWLDGRIDPLPPPTGTFELIKRRARRRKYRRLALTAGAAAVIAATAVTVPQVVNLPVLNPATATGAANAHTPTPTSSAMPSTATASETPVPEAAPAPVPPGFKPTSVTFIGTDTGWVIGQAGTPGHCSTQYCTSVARTDDAGKTWIGVPAPVIGPADGATGVSQIRFLNLSDGWAFGPQLFATRDGGHTWSQVVTNGLRVTDLETVGDRAFALFASCTGTGTAFAAQCTSYTLYSSPASSDDWTPVGPSTSGLTSGPAGAASLVLTGTRGYLLAPDGTLYAGPVNGGGSWRAAGRVPCQTGTAQPDGQPAGSLLGAVNATALVYACTPPALPGGLQKKLIFTSADGGASWQQVAVAPAAGVATSLAASPVETFILGTNRGIEVLPAGGTSWQRASVSGGVPAGGFSFVGMTTATQGVAVPATPTAGAVWFTYDGGQAWVPSRIS
jgi:photosystem II stability/assembly factor-like uncharacterized protein